VALAASLAATSCSSSKPANAPDSAAVAQQAADSAAKAEAQRAADLQTEAESQLATLLKNPGSATFDSLKVVQPPESNGRLPAMAACGRISGKPGIGGHATPTAFIYQSRQAVFVDDAVAGHAAFVDLWGKLCAVPPGRVVAQ
jgi:hypothetical protein